MNQYIVPNLNVFHIWSSSSSLSLSLNQGAKEKDQTSAKTKTQWKNEQKLFFLSYLVLAHNLLNCDAKI